MKALVHERKRAIALRKKGFTYNDILKEVTVAKSSLSLWFKDLPLDKNEKKMLRKKRDANSSKGRLRASVAHRRNSLERQKVSFQEALAEFQIHKDQTLFHTGVALYWAEGAKRSNAFQFMNSDERMVKVMLKWIERYTSYTRLDLGYRLYIHKPYIHEHCEEWWAKKLQVPISSFKRTIYKPSGLGVKKRPNYMGCLRVEVPRSTALFRKMTFWQNLLIEYHHE